MTVALLISIVHRGGEAQDVSTDEPLATLAEQISRRLPAGAVLGMMVNHADRYRIMEHGSDPEIIVTVTVGPATLWQFTIEPGPLRVQGVGPELRIPAESWPVFDQLSPLFGALGRLDDPGFTAVEALLREAGARDRTERFDPIDDDDIPAIKALAENRIWPGDAVRRERSDGSMAVLSGAAVRKRMREHMRANGELPARLVQVPSEMYAHDGPLLLPTRESGREA